jgi:hypothetical protein
VSAARLPRPVRRLLLLAGAALAAVGLVACTSSGDGGEDLVNDFLGTGALYESDSTPGSGTTPYVAMEQSVDERDEFCVAVSVFRVTELYSVAFTLQHDPAQAAFKGSTTGNFLGVPASLLVSVDGSTPGQVIVGLSRRLTVHGMTGVMGEGELIELCYDVVGDGEGRMNFIPNLALEDPAGDPVPNGPAVFVGGDLSTGV